MCFPARKGVLIITTVGFAAMVTGLSFQLHLLSHDHHDEHDSDECSVCRHFLTAPGKFMQEPKSELPGLSLLESKAEFPLHVCVNAFHHNPFNPRGPPPA